MAERARVNQRLTATLMRIYLDEDDRYAGAPLYMAVVQELRKSGFGGASVFKGIEGYGDHRQVHAARIVDFSTNLPVLIEAIDVEEKIRETLPRLREMIGEGLITLERVEMLTVSKERK